MKTALLLLLSALALLGVLCLPTFAQPVDIPGLGKLDRTELPPELRENIHIPGEALPRAPLQSPDEKRGISVPIPSPEIEELIPPFVIEEENAAHRGDANQAGMPRQPAREHISNEEAVRLMYEQRAYPLGLIPDDAYENALKYIEQMREVPPPPVPQPEPESWLLGLGQWFASLWEPLGETPAFAQSGGPWIPIGPGPLKYGLGIGDAQAGLVDVVTVDPQSSQRIYLGTFLGGVWKTTTGGNSWSALTDDQASLDIGSVAVHPTDANVILAGTGKLLDSGEFRPAGVLRTTNQGTYWCQIGPTYNGNQVAVPEVTIDDSKTTLRVWASTSKGLWWSDSVLDPTTYTNCPAADGTCSNCFAVQNSWTRITSLDRVPGTPDRVNHLFVSSWNKTNTNCTTGSVNDCTIYTSIFNAGSNANRGWYRSANRGGCWQKLNPDGFTSGGVRVDRSVIARTPTPPNVTGTDVIYSIISSSTEGPLTQCGGSQVRKVRLYKGVFPDAGSTCTVTGQPWQLVNDTRTCSTAADCCDPSSYCACLLNGVPQSTCPVGQTCTCSVTAACDDMRSVAVDPTTTNVVAVGAVGIYRTTDAGATGFKGLGFGVVHVDHNGLAFDLSNHDVLFDGNDGGIWKTSANFSNPAANPTFTTLNTNLTNNQFYSGDIDALNYGASAGGMQDQGTGKGGNPLSWAYLRGGDDGKVIFDRANSNFMYLTWANTSAAVERSTDGGATFSQIVTGLPHRCDGGTNYLQLCTTDADCPNAACTRQLPQNSLAADPNDHRNLLVYSQLDQQVFRTTNADASDPSWCAITSSTPFPNNTLPTIPAMAVAPSSGVIFGATTGQIVRAPNACACNSCTWEKKGAAALAGTSLSSVTIDTSQTCNATTCTLYVTNVGLDSDPNAPIRVFRSTDSGTNWQNVSGSSGQCSSGTCPNGFPCVNGGCPYALPPNVAANSLVIHPGSRTTLYVGTDMGIYQGCLSCRSSDGSTCNPTGSMVICNPAGTVWTWSKFMTGFPKTAQVNRLAVHADSGVMRAFTFGRSAWEIPSANYPLPNPDLRVNTTNPTTDVAHNSARLSSGNTGQEYAVGWADDRRWCSGSLQPCTQDSDCPSGQTCNGGASSWHIFFRGYNYDANGHPTPISSDLRVDTTNNTHVAQAPAISGHPTADNALPYCARLAWHDDRLAPGVNQHVYTQYFCTDGYKLFTSDLRCDQHATNINATNAAIAFQQSLDFATAWQADRTVGGSLHDIYARCFGVFGVAKGNQFKVNTSTLDATSPAMAGDASSNVFIAWEEFDSATLNGKIMISKYNASGSLLAGPVQVDNNGVGTTGRHEVNLAVDTAGNILMTWWEGKSDGSQPEAVFRRRFTNALAPLNGENETQVNNPPQLPVAKRALRGSVGADVSGNFAISWWANVNDQTDLTGNIFAKGYDSSASILKSDFRVDLAPRTGLPLHPRIARSPFTNCYSVVWRDNRAGHYDVYTRTVTTQ